MGAAISYLQLLFAEEEVSLLTLASRLPFESPETAVTAFRASTPGTRPPLCGLSGAPQQRSDLCASCTCGLPAGRVAHAAGSDCRQTTTAMCRGM